MNPLRQLFLRAARSRWLARRIPELPPVRRAVQRFIPGESLDDALDAVDDLEARGLASLLTHLGENVEDAEDADAEVDHYLRVLDRAARRDRDAEISIKLTHLGLDLDAAHARDNVDRLVERAAERDSFVWIDMESSDYTDPTLELFEAVRDDHRPVGVCVQAYLHRTPVDTDRLLDEGASLRLVKGAYDEPPSRALQRKSAVDAAYVRLARRMLRTAAERGIRQTFGTHDLDIVDRIRTMAGELGVPDDRYEIQMLYGIRNRELERLAAEGPVGRVLISYGEEWFPWYMRRLAERPANLGFVLRNLLGR